MHEKLELHYTLALTKLHRCMYSTGQCKTAACAAPFVWSAPMCNNTQ